MSRQKYIPKQRDRIEELMHDRLSATKLGDTVTAEVSGPQMVPVMSPQGQTVGVGWQLTVYLAHNKLIGQEPVFVSVPLSGILLNDATINSITDRLLDEARKVRAKTENPEAAQPSAADMMRALQEQQAQTGNGQSAS